MVNRLGRTTWLLPASVRRFVRSREVGLTLFAALVGVIAAALVDLMGALANEAHYLLFGLRAGDRLSGIASFSNPLLALWPVAGGAVLCAMNWLGARVGRTNVVDPIEANALRGGIMSFRDSVLLALQTLVSNGFGASVGLEAGYTQLGSGVASRAGSWMHLRREDMRIIVGCGAAGAIAAAFDGPLTGAFYAFELVLARYAIGYVAPVMAAAISATLATHAFGGAPFHLSIVAGPTIEVWNIPLFITLGAVSAIIGIFWMRAVPVCERLFKSTRLPRIVHPMLGGLGVGGIAIISPQVLAGGHGALQIGLFAGLGVAALLLLAGLKLLATTISLGAGFRGGLFFSSLLVGALMGRSLGLAITLVWPEAAIDLTSFSLVGMGAMAAAVIGTPLTMSFLVLETTSDYALTVAVLAASITSNLIVRETFGYSFSTWRFHLSGETIRSARDVGWARELIVERLMRHDPATSWETLTIGEFQKRFPLGSRQLVALVDTEGRYRGLVTVAEAHAEGHSDSDPVLSLAHSVDGLLLPHMSVKEAMRVFDASESDTLAVVDTLDGRKLLGTLKESYATRRYAEEIEKAEGAL
jgi:CIC family chloride channel protein